MEGLTEFGFKIDGCCSFEVCEGIPNFPCRFSQAISLGSTPSLPAHVIWTPSNPRSLIPLAHTAANASPIRLNDTSAVPSLTSFEGVFFFFEVFVFIESTIESLSVSPNGCKRAASDSGVVRLGRAVTEYLRRTVVSRVPDGDKSAGKMMYRCNPTGTY